MHIIPQWMSGWQESNLHFHPLPKSTFVALPVTPEYLYILCSLSCCPLVRLFLYNFGRRSNHHRLTRAGVPIPRFPASTTRFKSENCIDVTDGIEPPTPAPNAMCLCRCFTLYSLSLLPTYDLIKPSSFFHPVPAFSGFTFFMVAHRIVGYFELLTTLYLHFQ